MARSNGCCPETSRCALHDGGQGAMPPVCFVVRAPQPRPTSVPSVQRQAPPLLGEERCDEPVSKSVVGAAPPAAGSADRG
jgi:hypothetical protein